MSEHAVRNRKGENNQHGAFSLQDGPDWLNVIPNPTVFGHIREQGKRTSKTDGLMIGNRHPPTLPMRDNPAVLTGFLPLTCLLEIIRN
ncbi:hypothetical protein HKD21_10805 [Gluconobacter cerevisiae]|uniref:Transposase n=1 Tax=Gluconobacter cerevisiae TaxID=1379734 RepID=A0ABR9YF85_9PROT|nr:hypothetical protein [Gluconobacter cerevisiae]MBF0877332.1 hypothetical protein [Gluconobacter cerevisiae]